jgi:hypothetical protein
MNQPGAAARRRPTARQPDVGSWRRSYHGSAGWNRCCRGLRAAARAASTTTFSGVLTPLPPELLWQLAALLADPGPVRVLIERGGRRVRNLRADSMVTSPAAAWRPRSSPCRPPRR